MESKTIGYLDSSRISDNSSDIYKKLKPFIIILHFLGVYFDVEDAQNIDCRVTMEDGFRTCKKENICHFFSCSRDKKAKIKPYKCCRCSFCLKLLYNILVLLALLCNIVRMLYSMVYTSNLSFGLTYGFLLWYSHNVVCLLCIWFSCGKKHFRQVFRSLLYLGKLLILLKRRLL